MLSDLKTPATRHGQLDSKQYNNISVTSVLSFKSTASSERDLVCYKKEGNWLMAVGWKVTIRLKSKTTSKLLDLTDVPCWYV